jgi:hypothetical protein
LIRLVIVALSMLVVAGSFISDVTAQFKESIDLPALVLSPLDPELSSYLHLGAFHESIAGEAANVAAYRNHTVEAAEIERQLTADGRGLKYISLLGKPSKAPAGNFDSAVRSYFTTFNNADGAAAAFAMLEDETGAVGAEDRIPSRIYGEETDLTYDTGFDVENRPFRALDLTFRMGALIAGVALTAYPSAEGIEPDQGFLETLAGVLEQRILAGVEADIGSHALIIDPGESVTLDNAYYRIEGSDVPLAEESSEATKLRQGAYGNALDVYQVFQTVEAPGSATVLYSDTLYRFALESDAASWMDEFPDLVAGNSYYAHLLENPVGSRDLSADATRLFTFAPGGSGVAPLLLARKGAVVARIQLVSLADLDEIGATVAVELMALQLECLNSGVCASIPASAIVDLLPIPAATPGATPDGSPIATP